MLTVTYKIYLKEHLSALNATSSPEWERERDAKDLEAKDKQIERRWWSLNLASDPQVATVSVALMRVDRFWHRVGAQQLGPASSAWSHLCCGHYPAADMRGQRCENVKTNKDHIHDLVQTSMTSDEILVAFFLEKVKSAIKAHRYRFKLQACH